MYKKMQIQKQWFIWLSTIFLLVIMCACGDSARNEPEEKSFGIYFSQNEPMIQEPEQIICGQDSTWAITTIKNDVIYQLVYETETAEIKEIEWQQNENEVVINIAEQNGTLYAEIQNTEEHTLEIRKCIAGVHWSTIMTTEQADMARYIVGSGLFVDSSENIYLVSGDTVTRFDTGGEQSLEYKLKGRACFFQENKDGYVDCIAQEVDGITLYELTEDAAKEKWKLEISARQVYGIKCSEEETLCLATEEKLLFIDRSSGNMLAQSELTAMGVPYIQAGFYNAEKESLRLYGKNIQSMSCSLLRSQDASAEQRIELVYGTYGWFTQEADLSMKSAILEFNQSNTNYYITIKSYPGDNGLEQLQADMASGNAPDIIDLYSSMYYESYVRNGYLEDLSPYLEQSEYKDDVLWNVLDTFKINNGLYLLTPHFQLYGILIHPEYKAYVEEWNMETFLDLVEKNQWEKNIIEPSAVGDPMTLLQYIIAGRQEEFLDWEKKMAWFETESFTDLLVLCREYASQDWPDTSEWTYNEFLWNTICTTAAYSSFSDYIFSTDVYGRDYSIYGYPTSSGQAYQIKVCPDCCGIYAGSRNKEGAWEFVESLLEESHIFWHEAPRYNWGFPVRISLLKDLEAENATVTGRVGDSLITMTESEFLILEDILYHETFIHNWINENIWNVIEEESAAYFAGDKSAEDVAHIIQSRVEIILNV